MVVFVKLVEGAETGLFRVVVFDDFGEGGGVVESGEFSEDGENVVAVFGAVLFGELS